LATRVSVFALMSIAAAYGCATSGDAGSGGDDAGGASDGAVDAHVADASPARDSGADAGDAARDAAPDSTPVCLTVMVPDAGPPDSGTASDGGADADADAATDAAIDGEAGVVDAGSDAGGGVCAPPQPGQCGPGDVSTFVPTWHPPSGLRQGLCTMSQISDYYTFCLDPNATASACQNFQLANASCTACLSTDESAATYGPLVGKSIGIVSINVAGCIALLEPCNLECAQASMAHDQCNEASCGPNCPVFDSTSLQTYTSCGITSDQCGCAWEAAREICTQSIQGSKHPAAVCVTGATTFQQYFETVAPIFCGQ
jgi:hypothetical protein